MRALTARLAAAAGALLRREVIPDPRGLVSFGILIFALSGFLAASPDAEGRLGGSLLGLLPVALRGPRADVVAEGYLQAFLMAGPGISAYLGVRHLVTRGDSLLPVFTALGGTFVSLLLGVGLTISLLS